MRNEADLRKWVKSLDGLTQPFENKTLKCFIEWIEPGTGGTDGICDVNFRVNEVLLPIELKVWEFDEKGFFKAKLEKSQVRYHAVCAKRNIPTAIMWGTKNVKNSVLGLERIFVVHGKYAPHTVNSKVYVKQHKNELFQYILANPFSKYDLIIDIYKQLVQMS